MIVKFRSCHICNQLSFPGHFKKKKKKLYLYIGTQLESEVVTYPSDPPMARLLLNTPTSRWRCKSLPSKKKTGCDVGVVWIVGFFPCCLDCWFFELNEVSLFFFSGWWACFFVDSFKLDCLRLIIHINKTKSHEFLPKGFHDVCFHSLENRRLSNRWGFNWGSRPKLLLP